MTDEELRRLFESSAAETRKGLEAHDQPVEGRRQARFSYSELDRRIRDLESRVERLEGAQRPS